MEPEQDPNTGVRVFRCQSWEEFIVAVRRRRHIGSRIFRGHRDVEWKLSSAWERWLCRLKGGDPTRNIRDLFSRAPCEFDSPALTGLSSLEKIRDGYLQRFKDLVVGLPGVRTDVLEGKGQHTDADDTRKSETERNWWAFAQHSGLGTPLLDWTKSPHIASFFAFTEYIEHVQQDKQKAGQNPAFWTAFPEGGTMFGTGNIAVWELILDDDIEEKGVLKIFTSRVDEAFQQNAQQSVFTWLTHDVHVDLESYLSSRGIGHLLGRYEIPGQDMVKALYELQLMGINWVTLFPNPSNAAKQANMGNYLEILGQTSK